MSDKQFLELPYGKDDFPLLREGNCYFVDKTPYLKTARVSQIKNLSKSRSTLGLMLFKNLY